MLHNFKVSDASRHVWDMFVIDNKNCHYVKATSPKGTVYTFVWRNGELEQVSARNKMYRVDGKFFETPHSFREVVSLVPMWLLKKMDFYYKVNIAG